MKNIVRSLIYILDDEALHGQMLKNHLEKKDFTVHNFTNSDDLFEHIHSKNPEIIFLDYNLSQKEFKKGIDVLIKIKNDHPAIEVVIYSGQDDIEVATDTIKHGAYDYIIKGKTAVHKAEILAENIKEKNNSKAESNKLKLFIGLLMGGIVAFAVVVLVLWQAGIFFEN